MGAPAAHPKYSVMIAAAITALKDRTGSSRAAILKHVVANNKVDAAKAATQVRLSLKRGVAKGALKMAAAKGKNAGSYKLPKVVKPKKVKKVKKVVKRRPPRSPRPPRRWPRSPLPRRLPRSPPRRPHPRRSLLPRRLLRRRP